MRPAACRAGQRPDSHAFLARTKHCLRGALRRGDAWDPQSRPPPHSLPKSLEQPRENGGRRATNAAIPQHALRSYHVVAFIFNCLRHSISWSTDLTAYTCRRSCRHATDTRYMHLAPLTRAQPRDSAATAPPPRLMPPPTPRRARRPRACRRVVGRPCRAGSQSPTACAHRRTHRRGGRRTTAATGRLRADATWSSATQRDAQRRELLVEMRLLRGQAEIKEHGLLLRGAARGVVHQPGGHRGPLHRGTWARARVRGATSQVAWYACSRSWV